MHLTPLYASTILKQFAGVSEYASYLTSWIFVVSLIHSTNMASCIVYILGVIFLYSLSVHTKRRVKFTCSKLSSYVLTMYGC